MSPTRYIVAVRRECRADAPVNWADQIAAVEGVEVVGVAGYRVQVEAGPEAAERLAEAIGDFAHVEPAIEHRPSAPEEGFRPV